MTIKTIYIIGIGILIILSLIGFLRFGLAPMDDKDRYGDLVYFNLKVENGDLIFRCNNPTDMNSLTEFNHYGIIEKSFGKVYVWNNQNTMKKNLYDWAEKGKGKRVRVFRAITSDFDIRNEEKKNGNYNYLMNSDNLKFVIENY